MFRSLLLLACCCTSFSAEAAVIVVANRAATQVSFSMLPGADSSLQPRQLTLAAREVIPIVVDRPGQLSFTADEEPTLVRVAPHGLYYFHQTKEGRLDLGEIGLSTPEISLDEKALRQSGELPDSAAAEPSSQVIPVKILYDDAEVHTRAAWERRMRARFDEASRIFKKHCFVEFRIVAIESWHSDGDTDALWKALAEFERVVDPAPARLAIGFSGRLKPGTQDRHMGGTRGPLHTHLLIRERVNKNSEPERLEILVHELGHFLGAVHSPEATSVMRVALGDRQARSPRFRIGFDPLNTMAMCLVSQELRVRPEISLAQMRIPTRAQLLRLYVELARGVPGDPSAPRYLKRLGVTFRQSPDAAEPN